MIKIGLLGFDFKAPNKGCEALSYAFIEMLVIFRMKAWKFTCFLMEN